MKIVAQSTLAPYLISAIKKELSEHPNSEVSTYLKNSDNLFTINQQERGENGKEDTIFDVGCGCRGITGFN